MKIKILTSLFFLLLSLSVKSQIAFTKEVISSTGGFPYVIDSGQLSNDLIGGEYYNDIVVGTDGGSTVEYYKNLDASPMRFDSGTALSYGTGAELSCVDGIHIADINNDDLNDVIATGYCNDRLVWFENNGDGTFADSVLITTTSTLNGPGTVTSANLDNDVNGYQDLVVVIYGPDDNTDSVIFLIGDGTGGFTSEGFIVPETAGIGPSDIDLKDFDGDGDIDAVVSFADSGDVYVYDNNLAAPGGTVSFTEYSNVVDGTNGYVFSVTFGDVNNDTQLDVVVVDNSPGANPRVAWYAPTFSPSTPTNPADDTTFTENIVATANDRPARAIIANINNDMTGYNDIVISNANTAPFDITWRRGNNMAPPNEFDTEETVDATQASVYGITINDFDNDGFLDIGSISALTNQVSWFLNDGNTLSSEDNLILTENISIYPNPATNQLNFRGNFNSDLEVSVYDVLGKRIINKTVKYGQSLDVSKLNNGLYIIKFEGYDNTYKFVKN
mgnify:FL=1